MTIDNAGEVFTAEVLAKLFPAHRADQFFEAMYGESSEGAYDIQLGFQGIRNEILEFQFNLRQRPGKCLVCNLTFGLPQVFSRHPIINIEGLVKGIESMINHTVQCNRWELGQTKEISSDLHVIPLTLYLADV